jgi:hypothetical protein
MAATAAAAASAAAAATAAAAAKCVDIGRVRDGRRWRL